MLYSPAGKCGDATKDKRCRPGDNAVPSNGGLSASLRERTDPMATLIRTLAAMAVLSAAASGAMAQPITEERARAIIAPWYSLFNVATRGDVKTTEEQVLTADYESCSGYL